jgi:hypothetical protein
MPLNIGEKRSVAFPGLAERPAFVAGSDRTILA